MGIEVVKEQLNGYRLMIGVLYAGMVTGAYLNFTQEENIVLITATTIILFILLIIVVILYYGRGRELKRLEEELNK